MGNEYRSTGKVARLPAGHRDVVEQMLLAGVSYREIVDYLREQGHGMSQMAISNYARKYLADIRKLNIAQENQRMMMEELDKYPNLDSTEGIVRIMSSYMFSALASMEADDWREDIDSEQLFRQAIALIRASAYKKRTDIQNQSTFDSAIEAARLQVFDALAKERPDLFREISSYLSEKKVESE